MPLNMKAIGLYIQSCRKEGRMTQAELGERLHVSAQSVSNWERGETLPEPGVMLDMADIFGCSLDALLRGGHCAGTYRRQVTVAQMREAIGCIHRLYDLLGKDHFMCRTMLCALDDRMNSAIEPCFANSQLMDSYICEALLASVRDCGAWVDVHDVRRNIDASRPKETTIRLLQSLGMK